MNKRCAAMPLALALCSHAAVQTPAANPIAQLVGEALRNNPDIRAAEQAVRAASHAVAPASTLPDPEVSLQQMDVGNPLPFAGYRSSDFAYIGIGVSQALPYPGKLRLQGEIAQHYADASRANLDLVRRRIKAEVQIAYIQLAYLQKVADILRRDQDLLRQTEQLAEERYATGQIAQGEVLDAQLEQTKILRELVDQNQQSEIAQAQLRQLLGRPAGAAPIAPVSLPDAPASGVTAPASVAADPRLAAQQAVIAADASAVQLARKNFLPDFNAQYRYERTGPGFRDYYQWTLGMSLPLHPSRRQQEELAQAVAQQAGAQSTYDSIRAQDEFTASEQSITVRSDEQKLTIYRDGLLPQAASRLQSATTAFEENRGSLAPVLEAYRSQLDLEQQYWHTVADRATALARLQQITGAQADATTEAGHE